jgi:hypothetical protein
VKSWGEVRAFIALHKLPYTVIQWNMSLRGCLVDTASGETLADTVKDAAKYLIADQTNLGDCVWCFQPASGPHKKAVTRVWSREWSCYMEVCKKHGEAIERENSRSDSEPNTQEGICL